MNLLLDTHAYLWFIAGDERLSTDAREAIENPDYLKMVSTASLWEITIKYSLGKLHLKDGLQKVLTEYISSNGFNLLPIETGHLLELGRLAMHHRDPFDRLLVAQAKSNRLAVCSADRAFKKEFNVVIERDADR